MKVFFLIEQLYNSAGTERIATDVVNELSIKTDWDIKFIVLNKNIKTAFTLNDKVKVVSLSSKLSSPIKAIRRLRNIIKSERPDYIINVATIMSRISIPATILTNTKVITWEHFNLYAGSKLGYLWRIFSATLSDITVVLTHRDLNCYPSLIRKKLQTIYNFPTEMKGNTSLIKSNVAISVGRLTYQKGFDILLDVWKKVVESGCKWKLYIIGSGEDEVKLKETANKLGLSDNVSFIPNTPNISEYYEEASLYIMTSRYEGLPLVLIEAKQKGLPCISFNCPNGPDEIIRDNKDGYIIDFGDYEGMANAILELTSKREKLKDFSTESIMDVKSRFCKDRIIEQWIDMLNTHKK